MVRDKLLKITRGEEAADLVFKNCWLVDVFNEELVKTDLAIADGIIVGTDNYSGKEEIDLEGKIILPGFIDGHLHLESAMVRVSEFAKEIIPRGTTTVVADPHEIANVAGIAGIRYLLNEGRNLPWNFKLMLPSCVPATKFETAGANLKAVDLKVLLEEEGIFGLGEVMDFTGVVMGSQTIWNKIEMVGDRFKDGHAPGLTSFRLNTYLLSGIKADHECTKPAEALEKVSKGMYVMIREGSVTRDLLNLIPVVNDRNSSRFLLATDDRHPVDLVQEGHLDFLIKKAIANGMPPLRAIKLATINASLALGLPKLGALAPGYQADLVVVDDLNNFKVEQVYKDGKLIAEKGRMLFESHTIEKEKPAEIFASVNIGRLSSASFKLPLGNRYRVIKLIKDQVITKKEIVYFNKKKINSEDLIVRDLVKIAVVERHLGTGNVGLGLLEGYGLKSGAIATSVGHDSHNILVAGLNKEEMLRAVREVEKLKGGIVLIKDGILLDYLALPIAGLLATESLKTVALKLGRLKEKARLLGVKVKNPFMTLSFLTLPVIPQLKLTDKGLFDLEEYNIVPLVID